MTAGRGSTHSSQRRRAAPEAVASWSFGAALLLGLAGVADLARWGNRWYITEVFARDAGSRDGASWEYVYRLLDGAHGALVRGLALLLLAAAFTAITIAIRRRGAR